MESDDGSPTISTPRPTSVRQRFAYEDEDSRMNYSSRAYEEKRSFIRMKIDTMITFTIEGKKHPQRYEGRCKNISGAGLLLETSKKIEVGDKLNIIIPSENKDLLNLNATVEIIRVTPFPEQHRYELGGVITQIKS